MTRRTTVAKGVCVLLRIPYAGSAGGCRSRVEAQLHMSFFEVVEVVEQLRFVIAIDGSCALQLTITRSATIKSARNTPTTSPRKHTSMAFFRAQPDTRSRAARRSLLRGTPILNPCLMIVEDVVGSEFHGYSSNDSRNPRFTARTPPRQRSSTGTTVRSIWGET